MQGPAQQFNSLIEDNLAKYFDLKLKTYQTIASIDLHAPVGSPELDCQISALLPRGLSLPCYHSNLSACLLCCSLKTFGQHFTTFAII